MIKIWSTFNTSPSLMKHFLKSLLLLRCCQNFIQYLQDVSSAYVHLKSPLHVKIFLILTVPLIHSLLILNHNSVSILSYNLSISTLLLSFASNDVCYVYIVRIDLGHVKKYSWLQQFFLHCITTHTHTVFMSKHCQWYFQGEFILFRILDYILHTKSQTASFNILSWSNE